MGPGARRVVLGGIVVLTALCAAWMAAGAGAQRSLIRSSYLAVASKGVRQASAWANRKYHWYNAVLHDHSKLPQATTIDAAPLFEAVDYLALANPSSANKRAVVHFANHGELYWDRSITPSTSTFRRTPAWSPYPSQKGDVEAYFDANGWWSLAFMDAYAVTHNTRYLGYVQRDFKFIAQNGWDAGGGGGFWRDTHHTIRDGDSLAAAIDLAARLYQTTKRQAYLADADRWITWADANLLKSNGTYTAQIPHSDIMPHDGEGAMLGAFTTLCASRAAAPSHVGSWCNRAESFGVATVDQFFPLTASPQFDAVYIRNMLALYNYDHMSRWYGQAAGTAHQILHNARASNGLFLKGWDGSSRIKGIKRNALSTHASSVSVFAALAAAHAPS